MFGSLFIIQFHGRRNGAPTGFLRLFLLSFALIIAILFLL